VRTVCIKRLAIKHPSNKVDPINCFLHFLGVQPFHSGNNKAKSHSIGCHQTNTALVSRLISTRIAGSGWPQHRRSGPTETSPNFWWNRGGVIFWAENLCNISETRQDRNKVTIRDWQEVAYALLIRTKINDLGWPWTACFRMHVFGACHKKRINRGTQSATKM